LLPNDGLVGIPLTEPDASHLIGLVASDRDPLPPVAHALLNVAARLDIASTMIARLANYLLALAGEHLGAR
jgi:hypothetical protein